MKHQAPANYLKAHRKQTGLTQREIARVLGHKHPGQVSRHERSATIPPLRTALAYELIFCVPTATIFGGMRYTIRRDVEHRLRELEAALEKRSAHDRDATLTAQKLVWLNKRKTLES